MSSPLSRVESALPCRSPQIRQLYNLFGHKGEPFPECVYISGGPGVGKSAVVGALFRECGVKHAIINLIECYTSRILFESILSKLCSRADAKCDNMMDFVETLRRNYSELEGSVLIIDKAEKLLSMDCNLFPGFIKLRELSGAAVSVLFLSEIVLQKFYPKMGALEPLQIAFPQYNKAELVEILALNIEQEVMGDFDRSFYKNYISALLSVFYRNCRDLNELRYVARANFANYCKPALDNDIAAEDSMGLWRKVAPVFKQALQNLYLRVAAGPDMAQSLELPFYAKYLLIAAYLASHNSAKDDKRLFMKSHGKKRKTMKDVKKKSKVAEQLNTLLGPKPFTLDRLLAIFYSILDERVGFNNNILVQVTSLVDLQLLSSLSDSAGLDAPKYKCNVNFDFIQVVAKMVGFNIRKYLSDFSHL